MRAATHRPRPAGFTLIEMVVVIGIIVILLAIGAAFLPGLQGNQKVQNGVDRLAQWLLIAKNRAKHDGLPTGLLFLPSGTQVSQFVYVQQPDVMSGDPSVGNSCYTQPVMVGMQVTYPPSLNVLFNGVDFVGSGNLTDPTTWVVRAGDYLELFGGGGPFLVLAVTPPSGTTTYTTVTLSPRFIGDTGVSVPPSASGTGSTNWRIIRQPRRVPGEDVLTLPQDVVVDLGPIGTTGSTWSQNVPSNNQILFSPSGDVIGQSASSGKILLWVRDVNVPSPAQGDPNMQGNPTLVAISVRGGFLGTYPVLPDVAVGTQYYGYPTQFYFAALQGRSGF